MNTYVIAKATQMGQPDDKYGTTFWCEVQEQIQPVMFNVMSGTVDAGDRITAEEVMLKTSGKGTEYHRLKKVKIEKGQSSVGSVPGASQSAPTQATSGMSEHQFNQLLEEIKEIKKIVLQLRDGDEPAPVPDGDFSMEDIPY